MATPCKICGQQPFKYKCPACKALICSLPCSKKHKDECGGQVQAETGSEPKAEVTKQANVSQTEQGQTLEQRFEQLNNSPELKELLVRYPSLKAQLARIYNGTQEPPHGSGFHNAQGRSQTNRGNHNNQHQGSWSQQRADDSALKTINRARQSEGVEYNEGLREFLKLVRLQCGDEHS